MVLKSAKFDDVYFSADGGMAETHHVFIDGNGLPGAWAGMSNYTIAETGFGTGLNFLCAWKRFNETKEAGQRLHFISVEKYPLSKDEIKEALAGWENDLGTELTRLLDSYPLRVPGPHQIDLAPDVRLTLWFGDVNDVIGDWTGQVDAWFLDGFTPAKNPDMWSAALFSNMARLSHDQTTFATFTAAGFVRDGLKQAGFEVEKIPGFGRKRDMMRGQFNGIQKRIEQKHPETVAIIGGGLAGCALAHQFRNRSIEVHLYEAGDTLAAGASGGRLGMINPKLTAKPTPHSDYYTSAYANAIRTLAQYDGIEFNRCGSLHLCTDDDKARRFAGYFDNLDWHPDHIERHGEDLFYPDGAVVCPYKLCEALASNANVHLNYPIEALSTINADIIILANGYAMEQFVPDLPVHSVRGQVSWVQKGPKTQSNICFGGYITPPCGDGYHILGSSFEPWNISTDVTDQNHLENIERYNQVMDDDLKMTDIIGGWAALRTSSKDRFPMVGHVRDNIYISTAHGSHGIISSLMAAQIIEGLVMDGHLPVQARALAALSPQRFDKS